MNARLQLQATQLEGPIEFLSDEEGRRSTVSNRGTIERPWELWKKASTAAIEWGTVAEERRLMIKCECGVSNDEQALLRIVRHQSA